MTKPGLILPPGMTPRADALGTDPVGRGEWRRTNNTNRVAMALHDMKQRSDMTGPELFGALVENVIACIQGAVAPSDWRRAGDAVTGEIMRRLTRR
jgi:hypothetical protein